jgi:prepilin-type processing-associated H-X9-DG protein
MEQDNVFQQLPQNPGGGIPLPWTGMTMYNLWSPTTQAGAWAYSYAPYDYQSGVTQTNGTGYPKPAAEAVVKSYLCPSDNSGAGNNTLIYGPFDALGIYSTYPPGAPYSGGNFTFYVDYVLDIPGWGRELGRANYIGVGGLLGRIDPQDTNEPWAAPYVGIYYMSSHTKIADIKDGTSNTLAFGEYLGGLRIDGTRYGEMTWMGAGWWGTDWGLAPVYQNTAGTANNDYGWWQFQSNHPASVNFAFGDGSVRTVSRTADFRTFYRMSGMRDGKITDPTLLE